MSFSTGIVLRLLTLPDVELVALADITPARRAIGQAWFGLSDDQLYEDYRALLAIDEIDAVVIAVPQKHRPHRSRWRLSPLGKHVLSEKPISNVPADATELRSYAQSDASRLEDGDGAQLPLLARVPAD